MGVRDILIEIDREIAQLQHAKALLTGKSAPKHTAKSAAPKKRRKKRNLSPEGRKRIAEAVKKRWARQKAAAKKG